MPDIELIREYALKKDDVTKEFPFDDVTLVFKVKGKMFLLLNPDDDPLALNLKCDPELAEELLPYIIAQILGGIGAMAILYVIATGNGSAIGGFATNGYAEHSPGGFCGWGGIVAIMAFYCGSHRRCDSGRFSLQIYVRQREITLYHGFKADCDRFK